MQIQTNKTGPNRYLLNKYKSTKPYDIISPTRDKYYLSDQNFKDENYFLINNDMKFKDNTNNNSYNNINSLSDFNKYSSPELSDENYKNKYINKKYSDISYNNYETQKYLEDDFNLKYENENGNEKLHKIKDEYIEYLQKQLDENNKKLIKLETKTNEFQKRYKNLIEDNKLLNETLNERTSKLNEIIQENENLRLQLNNNIENENKIKTYYEKKINLYETSINDCNKIINDLKERNIKINKNEENEFNNYLNNNENNEEELQMLKNQNVIYLNNLKSKDNTIEFMTKENEKLINENKIYRTQIEKYTQQITNLFNTIKQKNKIINIFKIKEGIIDNCNDLEFEKKLEGMKVSFSQENIHFMNNTFNNNNKDLLLDVSKDDLMNSNTFNVVNKKNNDKINQSIDKLITENEENKMKIEMLNNKIKTFDQLEKKYFEFMKNNGGNVEDKKINININTITEAKKENDINKFDLVIKKEKAKNEEEKNMESVDDLINEENIDLKSYKKYIQKGIVKTEEKKDTEEINNKEEEDDNKQNDESSKMNVENKDKKEKENIINKEIEKEKKEKERKE